MYNKKIVDHLEIISIINCINMKVLCKGYRLRGRKVDCSIARDNTIMKPGFLLIYRYN